MTIKSRKFRDKRTGEIVTSFFLHEIQFFEEVKEWIKKRKNLGENVIHSETTG